MHGLHRCLDDVQQYLSGRTQLSRKTRFEASRVVFWSLSCYKELKLTTNPFTGRTLHGLIQMQTTSWQSRCFPTVGQRERRRWHEGEMLPSPQASLFCAAKAFWVTWSDRKFVPRVPRPFVSDTSLKRIDREGLGKRRTGTRPRQGKVARLEFLGEIPPKFEH